MDEKQIEENMNCLIDIFHHSIGDKESLYSINDLLNGLNHSVEFQLLLCQINTSKKQKITPIRFWMGGKFYWRNYLHDLTFLNKEMKKFQTGFWLLGYGSAIDLGATFLQNNEAERMLERMPSALWTNPNSSVSQRGLIL
jgi:hypothetical protein